MHPISLLRLKNESDGLTAEIADSAQIHGQTKHKTAKETIGLEKIKFMNKKNFMALHALSS